MRKFGPRTAYQTAGGRMATTYDRWSLGMQFGDTATAVAERMPQPIPQSLLGRRQVSERVPQMFRGLDQYTSKRDRSTGILSLVIHVLVAAGIISLGMFVPTKVVKTIQSNIAPIHLTLYDPPPPPVMEVKKVQGGGGGGGAHQV